MTPQPTPPETETRKETPPQEQYIRQAEDHSLPAQQVLTEQQDSREQDQSPALFVP